jgi:hypothetical protein
MTAMALLNDHNSFVLIRFIGSDRMPLPPFLCQVLMCKHSASIKVTSAAPPDLVATRDADQVGLLGGRRLGGFQPLGVEGAWKAPFLGGEGMGVGGERMAWNGTGGLRG